MLSLSPPRAPLHMKQYVEHNANNANGAGIHFGYKHLLLLYCK